MAGSYRQPPGGWFPGNETASTGGAFAMDPVTAALVMAGFSALGEIFGGGSSQPEMPARGEYTGPSPESLQSLADMKNYMGGGGLGGGTVDNSGGGMGSGWKDPSIIKMIATMFGGLKPGRTGQSSTQNNMFP